MNQPTELIRIDLTPEQKEKLRPLFTAVTNAVNESTPEQNLRGAIQGEAFEADGGYARFRFLDHAQAELVKAGIEAALDIDKRRELESRRNEIAETVSRLESEQAKIDAQITALEMKGQKAA